MNYHILPYSPIYRKDVTEGAKKLRLFLAKLNPERKEDIPSDFFEYWLGKIESEIDRNLALVYVATSEEKVIGYIYGLQSRVPEPQHVEFDDIQSMEIVDLYVDAEFQHNGVGTALIDTLITEAKKKVYQKVSLIVLSSNVKAVQYYERLGFKTEAQEMSKYI